MSRIVRRVPETASELKVENTDLKLANKELETRLRNAQLSSSILKSLQKSLGYKKKYKALKKEQSATFSEVLESARKKGNKEAYEVTIDLLDEMFNGGTYDSSCSSFTFKVEVLETLFKKVTKRWEEA